MHQSTEAQPALQLQARDVLQDILRQGARQMRRRERGGRVHRRPRRPAGRRRPAAGRPQRPPARAEHPDRAGAHRGPPAPRERPPHRRRRPPHPLHQPDSPAVPAADQEHRGVDSVAVPAGHQHGGLPASARGPAGPAGQGAFGDERRAAEGVVAAGMAGLVAAEPGRQGVRVRLGGRGALQRPAGGRGQPGAVHSGADGGDGGRHEGVDRPVRGVSGVGAVVEGVAAGREVSWPVGGRPTC